MTAIILGAILLCALAFIIYAYRRIWRDFFD
jgi:hypothetical protein